MIFAFMQLLCEGHMGDLQNFLRNQTDEKGVQHGKSLNIIRLSAMIYGNYIKFVNVHCTDLGPAILDFLIESV